MNKIKNFSSFLNESKPKTIIAYHGSPYRFNKFEHQKDKPLQLGADLGFWFTTEKKIARNVTMTYPNTYYSEQKNMQEKYEKTAEAEKIKAIKNIDFEPFYKFLLEQDFKAGAELVKSEVQKKNYDEVSNLIMSSIRFIGKRNFPEDIKNMFAEYFNIEQKYRDIIKEALNKIKVKYDKKPGYLYTVEITIGKTAIENGENLGVTWNRYEALDNYEGENYDTVFIKNADTGYGVGDEIVVFNNKNIKILDIEQILNNNR
jgi:hypothetical protein